MVVKNSHFFKTELTKTHNSFLQPTENQTYLNSKNFTTKEMLFTYALFKKKSVVASHKFCHTAIIV